MVDASSTTIGSVETRRTCLKAAGGGLAAVSLTGCLGDSGGTETLKVGAVLPTSGPFGAVGNSIVNGYELAISKFNNETAENVEFEMEVKNSETTPSVATQAAREHLDEDADFIAGGTSDAIVLALADFTQRQDVLYKGAGFTTSQDGVCRPSSFFALSSPYAYAHGSPSHPYRNDLGETAYTVTADYTWGQTITETLKNKIFPENEIEHVGNSVTDFGQTDFSSEITEAQSAEPDVVHFNMFNTQTILEADEFGLLDDAVCTWATLGVKEAQGISQDILSHENLYAGMNWFYPDTDASNEFSEEYHDEFDEWPTSYAAAYYGGLYTVLAGIDEAGTADYQEARTTIEGREFDKQMWEVGERYRACDHAGMVPVLTVSGQPESEVENTPDMFNIEHITEDPADIMTTCEDSGCDFGN